MMFIILLQDYLKKVLLTLSITSNKLKKDFVFVVPYKRLQRVKHILM